MLWDYIVVGAGLTGSVVTNRLLEQHPDLNVLVIEAGIDANGRQDIVWPNSTNGQGGEFDWNYESAPQVHLDDRVIASNAGKGLGGGTLINGAAWVRGHAVDYDSWGAEVGDDRWTYEGLLPYFRKTEDFFTKKTDPEQHGLEGPMDVQSISSLDRWFPMRKPLIDSWNAIGIKSLPDFDHNRGYPIGIGEMQENRNHGRRQQSSLVYPLDRATVLTETMVGKVLISKGRCGKKKAVGVQLANGTEIYAGETILAAGAYRTPQLLMLSGVGPKEELKKHDIDVVVDQPHVGQHMHDHAQIVTPYKLKNPSDGWAVESGNPLFDDPKYSLGLNLDFITTVDVPKDGLFFAIAEEEGEWPNPWEHPLLNQERAFASHTIQYSAASEDGSAVLSMTVLLIDHSRGSITLKSNDIKDAPIINANFMASGIDRYALREAIRHDLHLLLSNDTVVGREIVEGHMAEKPLTLDSTDDEIDEFIRQTAVGIFHPGGTATMGKVVDPDLKVIGIDGLRVVDSSILPHTMSANLQVCLYGVAEQAADIIGKSRK